jgi:hypothetical protein
MNTEYRTGLALIASVALAGCSSEGVKAEQQYEMVDATQPDTIEGAHRRCEAARNVEQGYLTDGNKAKHKHWVTRVMVMCSIADLREMNELDRKKP